MKITALLVFLFCQYLTMAQSIQGRILDAETKKPLSQITVFTADASVFVTSNQKGEITLDAQQVLHQTLYIDDYEYEVSEKTITSTESFDWYLVPHHETLEELVIYKRPIKDVLLEVIDHSTASFSKNTKIEAFYRENYLKNNRVETYAEGLMDFYIGKSLKNISTVVKQSRVVDLYTNPQDTIDMSATATEKPGDLIETSMRFQFLRKLITSKDYEYVVKSKMVGERQLYTCYISPKEKSTKRFLYSGYFVYDDAKKLILETQFTFDENKKIYNKTVNIIIAKIDFLDIKYKTKYVDTENFYYPTYANMYYDLIIQSKLAKIKDLRVNVNSYFYTLHFVETQSFPSEDQLFTKRSLFDNGNAYTESFWLDPSIQNLSE